MEKLTGLVNGLLDVLFKVLSGILETILTADTAMLMVLILGVTEVTKQGFKRYRGVRSLRNFEIQVCSLVYGGVFGAGFLTSLPLKQRILQGMFYSILATVLYWGGKRLIIDKYFPKASKALSGQEAHNDQR